MAAADRFRQIRRETGLSQVEFAVAIGCSRSQVARVETGRSEYRYSELLAITVVTGLTIAQVMSAGWHPQPSWNDGYRRLSAHDRERLDRVIDSLVVLIQD